MAVRIRKDGRVLCAAIHPKRKGDFYIPDDLHYHLSVVEKILVTQPWEKHRKRGEWWWKSKIPKRVRIDDFYLD